LKNPVVDTEVGASLYSLNNHILGIANKNYITGYIKILEQLLSAATIQKEKERKPGRSYCMFI